MLVLDGVDELVKQQFERERLNVHHNVLECNPCHLGKCRRIADSHHTRQGVKPRFGSASLNHLHARKHVGREEYLELLNVFHQYRLRILPECFPLVRDVRRHESSKLIDLFVGKFRKRHAGYEMYSWMYSSLVWAKCRMSPSNTTLPSRRTRKLIGTSQYCPRGSARS